jgi:DNA-binding CsgD family transcriptional regulator
VNHLVPLDSFEHDTIPVMAADEEGVVRFCNKAAAGFLRCDPEAALGRHCWSVMRFRSAAGAPFCSPDCPVQQQARRGRLEPRHRVVLGSKGREEQRLDLVTFLVPISRSGRSAVVHLLQLRSRAAAYRARPATRSMSDGSLRLYDLSSREREVLRLLGSGLDTQAIATRLSIRQVTVRNHVASILRKLRVHRRLDAVLLMLGKKQ